MNPVESVYVYSLAGSGDAAPAPHQPVPP